MRTNPVNRAERETETDTGKEQMMKRHPSLFVVAVLALVAMLAAGCESVNDPALPDGSADPLLQVVDLDSPTGGFSETDEEPLFGEPEVFMEIDEGEGEEDLYRDPLSDDVSVVDIERRRDARIYRFRALWGRMASVCVDSAANACCTVDWSGGMALEGGVIVIERIIRFDANDELVRTGPNTLRWKSSTCPHVDGVQVRLIVPPPPPPDSTEVRPDGSPLLKIVAGTFERSFTLKELEALRLAEPVDRCNNYMTIASHRIMPDCPSGYLLGRWMRLESPDTLYNDEMGKMRGIIRGRFMGIWVSENGWAVGHLKGFYGTDSNGDPKFFGKYIGPGGEFRGILAGEYGMHPTFAADPLHEMGWFAGHWYGRNHNAKGRLKGDWITSGAGLGYFKGIWGMLCNKEL
jgi:hypothetical protein